MSRSEPIELGLDESTQSQPLLDQIVNAKPSRCVGFDGLGAATDRLLAQCHHTAAALSDPL